jgi:hypothetical protein
MKGATPVLKRKHMRTAVGLIAGLGLLGGDALATPTVVGIATPPHDPNPYDVFEHATITASSPPTVGSYVSSIGDVFGGTGTTYPGEQGNLLFVSNGIADTRYVEFQTAGSSYFTGYSAYLRDTGAGERSAASFSLYARATPGPFTAATLISSKSLHPTYADPVSSGGYGSHSIRVSDQMNAGAMQYWRLEVTTASGIANGNNGTRIVELDASVSTNWVNDGAGDWNSSGNWGGAVVPNGYGAHAYMFQDLSSPRTIYADVPVTLSFLAFSSTGYCIGGTASLTMEGADSNTIAVYRGNHKINLPLYIKNNANVQIDPGATLTIADPLTLVGGSVLTTTGTGTLNIISTVNNTAAASLLASGPTVNAALDLSNTMTVSVTAGTVNLNATQHLAGLTGTGGQVVLADGQKVIRASQISLTGTSSLQLGDGRLVVDYASPGPSPLASVVAQVASGYAGGAWTGPGIRSSFAAGNSRLGIGVIEASVKSASNFNFAGETVDPTTVLAALTLKGDANLDFTVNFDDLLALAANYNGSRKFWSNGDFNYDGTVNFDDLLGLAANYNQTLTGSLEGYRALAQSAVPEPTAVLGVVLVLPVLSRRRRLASDGIPLRRTEAG